MPPQWLEGTAAHRIAAFTGLRLIAVSRTNRPLSTRPDAREALVLKPGRCLFRTDGSRPTAVRQTWKKRLLAASLVGQATWPAFATFSLLSPRLPLSLAAWTACRPAHVCAPRSSRRMTGWAARRVDDMSQANVALTLQINWAPNYQPAPRRQRPVRKTRRRA